MLYDSGRSKETNPTCPVCGDSNYVLGVCFSPDGYKVTNCSTDWSVKIWKLITRECVSTVRGGNPFQVFLIHIPLGHSTYVTTVSYSYLFSHVWCTDY